MNKRALFSFFVLTAFLLLGAGYARACSCKGGANPCRAFAGDKGVVFTGTVTEVTGSNEKYGQPVKGGARKIKIRVDEIFKGSLPAEIITSDDGYNCDNYPFRLGGSYLIYAGGVLENTDNIVKIGLCSGTRSVESAADDLRLLRQLKDGRTISTIYGRVEQFVNQKDASNRPLKNTKVRLVKEYSIENGQYKKPGKKDRETFVYTDENGEYSFNNIQLGRYNIKLDLPDGLWVRQRTEFESGGAPLCDNHSFLALTDGRISGKIVNADGTPAHLKLDIIPVNKDAKYYEHMAQTDKEGRYTFFGVPEGQYKISSYLGVYSLDGSRSYPFGDGTYPWSQYYFGNVFDQKQARVVTLTHAGRLDGVDHKMPPLPVKRTITGTISLAVGGTLPKGVFVTYVIKGMESSTRRYPTVKDGSFSFQIYEEFEYDVYAGFYDERLKQSFFSDHLIINAASLNEPLKLIIKD